MTKKKTTEKTVPATAKKSPVTAAKTKSSSKPSAGKASAVPEKKITVPVKKTPAAAKGTVPAKKSAVSVKKAPAAAKETVPAKKSTVPVKKAPAAKEAVPEKKSAAPEKKSTVPVKKAPAAKEAAPEKKSAAPVKKAPAAKEAVPEKKSAAPEKKSTAPVKKAPAAKDKVQEKGRVHPDRDIFSVMGKETHSGVDTATADSFLSANFSLFLKECMPFRYLEDRNTLRACIDLCVLAWNLSIFRSVKNLASHSAAYRSRFLADPEFSKAVKIMGKDFNPAVELLIEEKEENFSAYHDLIRTWSFDLKNEPDGGILPLLITGCAPGEMDPETL